jgi:FxsC-like protein
MSTGPAGGVGGQGLYFFVSYAHVPPPMGPPIAGVDRPDSLVRMFFHDLYRRVDARRAKDSRLGVGLFDQSDEAGPDLNASLAHGLGVAEVLVPLVSPRYVQPGSWPMSELLSFQQRLRQIRGDTTRHIQPVLWLPLPPGDPLPTGNAADLDADNPDYLEYGLGAMCELEFFRPEYERILDRLADGIVDVAQNSPIGPSSATAPAEKTAATPQDADFVIAVLAPTATMPPRDRRPDTYGPRPSDWAPFLEAEGLPVARQAAHVAERLDLVTAIVDLSEHGAGALDALRERPSIILIDPWILATKRGPSTVRDRLARLPRWVTMMVVTDRADEQFTERGEELLHRAIAMLEDARAGRGVRDDVQMFDQFVTAMPAAITQSRRLFLRSMPALYPPRPTFGGADSDYSPGGD